jgi:hypothetical protein
VCIGTWPWCSRAFVIVCSRSCFRVICGGCGRGNMRHVHQILNFPEWIHFSCHVEIFDDLMNTRQHLFHRSGQLSEISNWYASVTDLVERWGYPLEHYTVQTHDGYLLGLYRISHGRSHDARNHTSNRCRRELWFPCKLDRVRHCGECGIAAYNASVAFRSPFFDTFCALLAALPVCRSTMPM